MCSNGIRTGRFSRVHCRRPLRRLLERCLAKDPKARLRDISEARYAVDEAIAARSAPAPAAPAAIAPPVSRAKSRFRPAVFIPWLLSGALAILAVTLLLRPAAEPRGLAATTRVELTFPENVEFYTSPHIAANGRRVAFVGIREGNRQLYVRDLTESNARAIAGTEGTIAGAISADSQSAAVIGTDGRLRRIHLDSGSTQELANGVDIVGGLNWAPDGTIVFSKVKTILAVPPAGGAAREVAVAGPADSSLSHPAVTPDGKTILFTVWSGAAGALKPRIEAVPMAGGARHVVADNASYPLTSVAGQLLFQRSGALYGVRFDPASAAMVGTEVKLSDEPREQPIGGLAADISPMGDLLLADTRTLDGHLSWVGFDGSERAIAVPPRPLQQPARISRWPYRGLFGHLRGLDHRLEPRDPRSACLPATRVSPDFRSGPPTARSSISAPRPALRACAPMAAGRRRRCRGRPGPITRVG